jgi:outer membrane protein OmpA-like peptidoglycan-associated protein
MSDHDYQRRPLTLATGGAHTVKLPPRVMRGRLTGFLFDTNKTFLLPAALAGIRGLADFCAAHPGLKVLVTGHTDTVGPESANLALSDERAASVAAFLIDDVDGWVKHYGGTPGSSTWGTREDQHMLTALPDGGPPYYAGPVSGVLDGPTQDAVRRFQTDHGLTVDGVPGPQTRRALVTDYMNIDGTSLPAGTDLQKHGCGEYHPAVPTPDETEEQGNRRVEVFFFEGPIDPPPRGKCPHPGCPEYPEWLKRTILTIDFTLPPPVVRDPRWESAAAMVPIALTLYDQHADPCADHPATVIAGTQRFFIRTDGRGRASLDVPSGTTGVTVRYALPTTGALVDLPVALAVGGADAAGARKRLVNLGYPIDVDERYAVWSFQRDFGVASLSGELDGETVAKVVEVHGG